MKKEDRNSEDFESITAIHRALGLPAPQHPLISLLNAQDLRSSTRPSGAHVLNFYKISFKTALSGKVRYGQGYYDFDEGGLLFASPNQVIGSDGDEDTEDLSYYTMLIHPDFLHGYPLARKVKQYGYFSYGTNEALHLSESEKAIILSVFHIIEQELNSRIDEFSQEVVVSQIELLLNYANRFYKRQFITRKIVSNDMLERLEVLLDDYFQNEKTASHGIPTVQFLSDQLHVTSSYLSDMLRALTGMNAQQHIHNKLVEKAKEKLSLTSLTIAEIAFDLGFEHPQSFSRFFKMKAKVSPVEFRQAFN
ncbi:helix-turn-helix domain-containing protein [Flavobacterium sp. MFBS3-15]|uniref:helix-turn-helix domain-containing protein n=1 Tax=Flavobacterium sp. MFBS3-15 TaxID=2989816 RepID=UPI002235D956|nr:helix-turn-helix domain-containing protein [Flavobacterium sp. MFBS3-15]MCW4469810.1 helix-turn-helix domain-containing protein [Flavobacterium sp. MFBS3-15]